MTAKNILCVCAKGMNRSRYLAEYLGELGYKTKYGGVESFEKEPGKAPNPLSHEDVNWADVVIITRKRILPIFESLFKDIDKKVLTFDVPDLTWKDGGEETRKILQDTIKPFLPLEK